MKNFYQMMLKTFLFFEGLKDGDRIQTKWT